MFKCLGQDCACTLRSEIIVRQIVFSYPFVNCYTGAMEEVVLTLFKKGSVARGRDVV